MVVRCLIWSQAAIHKSWQATACSLITPSATEPRLNLPTSGGADGGETVNFNGKHIHVRGIKLLFPPLQQPYPPLYFGGSSDVAQELAAEQVVDFILPGANRRNWLEKIEQVRAKAARHGRQVRFGIRLHVIVRETNDEAWQAAERLISHLDDETIALRLCRIRPDGFRRPAANGGAT